MPRLTNVGPDTRNLHLATVAAIRGDRDEALSYLDTAYRRGFDPANFRMWARRFDVRGEWSDLLTDPRYLELVAGSDKMRAWVQAEMPPLLLLPDLELIQKPIPQDRPTG